MIHLLTSILLATHINTYCFEQDLVTIAILAKDKAHTLPMYLKCIENQTWPKKQTCLYIRTNNNTDDTCKILQDWVLKVQDEYSDIFFDASDTLERVEHYGQHEWNCERFSVLGKIRQDSMTWAYEHHSHYFVVDCDNFIKQNTLATLVETNLPIVAPLLRCHNSMYSNLHAAIDENGYYLHCPLYDQLVNREIIGLTPVPVVHCTYLVRREEIPFLYYDDCSYRYEYVIFSDSARKNNILQYFDNREIYGYCTMATDTASFYNESSLRTFFDAIGLASGNEAAR